MTKQDSNSTGVFLGIDLGTTFSSVAYINFVAGEHREKPAFEPVDVPLVFRSEQDDTDTVFLLPTIVDYGVSIPEVGKQVSQDSRFVVRDFKLHFGLQKEYRLPDDQTKTPEDAAIEVSRYLKRRAEDVLGKVDNVRLAMPPFIPGEHYVDKTDVLVGIGKGAGFKSVDVIEEPIAALVDLDFSTGGILTHEDKMIMIIDYGGGTCDIAIAQASYKRLFHGKPRLLGLGTEACGGKFIDEVIAQWLKKHRSKYAQALDESDLKEVARQLKEQMSDHICGGRVFDSPSKVRDCDWRLSHEVFENLSRPVVERMWCAVQQAMDEAAERLGVDVRDIDIDEVFLVGGGSQHPSVEQIIRQCFSKLGKTPTVHPADIGGQPQLSVSRGAALYQYYRASGEIPMRDELRQDLYIKFPGGSMKRLARIGQQVPFQRSHRFEIDVIDTSEDIILTLYRKDPKSGALQAYASPTLKFKEKVPAGTRLRLDLSVDLRQHVVIKAYPRKHKEFGTEAVVRRPIS